MQKSFIYDVLAIFNHFHTSFTTFINLLKTIFQNSLWQKTLRWILFCIVIKLFTPVALQMLIIRPDKKISAELLTPPILSWKLSSTFVFTSLMLPQKSYKIFCLHHLMGPHCLHDKILEVKVQKNFFLNILNSYEFGDFWQNWKNIKISKKYKIKRFFIPSIALESEKGEWLPLWKLTRGQH